MAQFKSLDDVKISKVLCLFIQHTALILVHTYIHTYFSTELSFAHRLNILSKRGIIYLYILYSCIEEK